MAFAFKLDDVIEKDDFCEKVIGIQWGNGLERVHIKIESKIKARVTIER